MKIDSRMEPSNLCKNTYILWVNTTYKNGKSHRCQPFMCNETLQARLIDYMESLDKRLDKNYEGYKVLTQFIKELNIVETIDDNAVKVIDEGDTSARRSISC